VRNFSYYYNSISYNFSKSNKTFYTSYSLIVINTGFTKNIQVKINNKIYIKDTGSSDRGKSIVESSIEKTYDIGMEAFSFKKRVIELRAAECTIYHYYENKHKLLINNVSWFWDSLEYEIVLKSININDPIEKLKNTLEVICNPQKSNNI
jgi:hypothetical protein